MSLVGDESSSQKVKCFRDTAATQSLMLDSVLPFTKNSFSGANVHILAVEMGVSEVPLHEVNIKSSLINGNIVIDMRPSLARVVEKPRDDEKTEKLAESSQVYSLPMW